MCVEVYVVMGVQVDRAAAEVRTLRDEVGAMAEAAAEAEGIKAKYKKEVAVRKKLYNELQELRGNLRVYCRV